MSVSCDVQVQYVYDLRARDGSNSFQTVKRKNVWYILFLPKSQNLPLRLYNCRKLYLLRNRFSR